jgi:hypothetical protein
VSRASRDKGLKGEREVAGVFEAAGWDIRGLESSGDWLAFRSHLALVVTRPLDLRLHLEVKRHEVLCIPTWWRQAAAEAPAGVPPAVIYRQSRTPWMAVLQLTDLLDLIG